MLFYFLLSRKSSNFEEIFKFIVIMNFYIDYVCLKRRKKIVRWANKEEGWIIDLEKNGVLRFVASCIGIDECRKENMDSNYPYVASGIVAWWFKYHKSLENFELFEKYYQLRLKQYKKERGKESDSFYFDIEGDFLKKKCLEMEAKECKKCQIYSYVSESDGCTISDMISSYFKYIETKELIYNLPTHMIPEERLKLEKKILSFLSKHDKEIDTSIKDSPQIYDYKDFKVYTDSEITEASLYLKQKGWIKCFNDYSGPKLARSYWHELLDEGKIALRKILKTEEVTLNSGNTHKKNQSANTAKVFRDIVQGVDEKEKDKIIKRLHHRIDNKYGKLVALYLLKAMELKLISKRPTEKEFKSEFTKCGKWHSVSAYLNPNKRVSLENELTSIEI